MKELNNEMIKINIEIGERLAEIEIKKREYGDIANSLIECINEEIKTREEKLQILKNAEMILLGIDYKKYQ